MLISLVIDQRELVIERPTWEIEQVAVVAVDWLDQPERVRERPA